MTSRTKMLAFGLVIVALAVVFYVRHRADSRDAPAGDTPGVGSAQRTTPRGSATLPPRRPRDVTPPPSGSAATKPGARPLVGLFDTGALCEQHNAAHCTILRDATARCDRGEPEGCRAALALVDAGPLRDMSLAVVFARRACDVGGDCARSTALARFREGESDPAARQAAVAACTGGDAVACAFAATTTADDAEAARHADLACRGGVIARGGCFDVSLSAHGSPEARAALDHACKSGSADGCDLLGRFAFERGELAAAHVAFARACELAPGSDGCTALDVLDRTGSVDPE